VFRLATAGGRLPLLAGWPRGVLTGAAVLIQPSVAAAAMLVSGWWAGGLVGAAGPALAGWESQDSEHF